LCEGTTAEAAAERDNRIKFPCVLFALGMKTTAQKKSFFVSRLFLFLSLCSNPNARLLGFSKYSVTIPHFDGETAATVI
jgi:hypothetical protein